MRIKVVTSINVRSSPFASPRVVVQDAFPEPHGDAILGEKFSTFRSFAPGQHPRMDRFIASQRIPRGSRLSGWLHGSSVRNNDRRRPANHTRTTSYTSTYCFAAAEQERHAPSIRSYPSTRGLIDPVHSPTYGPRQLTYGSDPRHDAYLKRLRAEMGTLPREHCSKRRHRQRSKREPAKKERLCFPQIKDSKMRQKIIGCVFFGTLLTIVLTTYLALAISDCFRTAAFHGVFIFFILVLTIFFCHYLIRLCTLAFEPRMRFARKCQSPLNADEEAGYAQPRQPIPVVLARDEQLGLHDDNDGVEEAEEAEAVALPPPPPAYGLWRSSVRADPNLIHWQAIGHNDDVQQETREMVFAGTGHRPPSYTSHDQPERVFDDRVEGVLEPEPVAAPLPLAAERRAAGTVFSRGGTIRMARSS
ncbi:hypothetical protein IMSHALPRED_004918 [Imshaugia aleurites]|uniref:Uncharacterized protein n=1 Tax=Imshaugia aleurites TaxID=172621 RepID=A0A8H3FGI5_9LECA|nr:hypothetical protein IMSHALPRED_004918 [Imshaugia aleurites]